MLLAMVGYKGDFFQEKWSVSEIGYSVTYKHPLSQLFNQTCLRCYSEGVFQMQLNPQIS